jgi:hypothetical protein
MQPLQIVVHKTGAETYGIPIMQIAVDFVRTFMELPARSVELSVMMEVVNTDFEAATDQFSPQSGWNRILSFGNEVEGGSEAEGFFEIGQFKATVEAAGAFDVVGEDDGEFFAIRPSWPILWGDLAAWLYRPDRTGTGEKVVRKAPPGYHPYVVRKVRLQMIICAAEEGQRGDYFIPRGENGENRAIATRRNTNLAAYGADSAD